MQQFNLYHRIDGILLASSTFQLFRESLSEKVHATIPKGIASVAGGILVPGVLLIFDLYALPFVAPPPNQHSTPALIPPATQATKGIVDGFESTVLQRNLKEWHERPWTYVCYC